MSSPRLPIAWDTPEEQFVLRALRGEAAFWPTNSGPDFERRFLDACSAEGIAALVHHEIAPTSAWAGWPPAVRHALLQVSRMRAALDMLQERELTAVLTVFAEEGIGTVLMKGAALAYTHYADPATRTRCDADVLIPPDSRAAGIRLLERLGYERQHAISGTLVSSQECRVKRDGPVQHVIDLHWRISNHQVFTGALLYEDVYPRSVPVPRLGSAARALSASDALLLACMHRAAHLGVDGPEGQRLIWLYDIHLIAAAMTAAEWTHFVLRATAANVRRVSLDAFLSAQMAFATPFPAEVLEALESGGGAELSARYLDASRAPLLLTNLRALTSWQSRFTLLRESLFPPAAYLLGKYESQSRWLLPWWYARRAAEGVWKAARS